VIPLELKLTPRRYKNAQGYVRLRWRIGPNKCFDLYEHRVVAGVTDPAMQVHHINHVKDDNRPENLMVLSASAHSSAHTTIDADEAKRLYALGLSIPEVGRRMGHDNASIYRLLVRHGVSIRPGRTYNIVRGHDDAIKRLRSAGLSSRRIAQAIGMSAFYVDARLRDMAAEHG
jgi:hypothetical protein